MRLGRALSFALTIVLSGCVAHPVGPARTFGKYEGKANTTAKGALSAVETVRIVADSASRGRALGSYVTVSVSDQEDALNKLRGTFGSIQPPDRKADEVRDELMDLLTRSGDDVANVRIAARRGELDRLHAVASPLADDSKALQDFQDRHKQ